MSQIDNMAGNQMLGQSMMSRNGQFLQQANLMEQLADSSIMSADRQAAPGVLVRDRSVSYDMSNYDLFKVDDTKNRPGNNPNSKIVKVRLMRAKWVNDSSLFKGNRSYEIHTSMRLDNQSMIMPS